MSKVEVRILAISFVALLLFSALGFGQEGGAALIQLAGKVLDPDNKAVGGAEIQLKNTGSGVVLTEKTSKKGEFTFKKIMPGKYSLMVAKDGFRIFSQDVDLESGAVPNLAISLVRQSEEERKLAQEAIAMFQNAMNLVQSGGTEEALGAFKKAIELKPDLAEAYYNMGLLLFQLVKLDEAAEALTKAHELKPGDKDATEALANVHFEKAKELLQQNKTNEALEKLKLSSSLNPNYSFTNYLLGYAYSQKGMNEEAIKSFEAFLKQEPNAPQAEKVKEIIEGLKKQK